MPFWQPLWPAFLGAYYVGALIFQKILDLFLWPNPLWFSGTNVSVPSGVTFFAQCHNVVKPQPKLGVFAHWLDVVDFLTRRSQADPVTVVAQWIVCPHSL